MRKLLFGLLAGISAGILFAPKTGKKLREQLKKSDTKFSDFGQALLETAQDAGGEVQEFLESKEVQKLLTSGKKSLDDFLVLLEEKGGDLSKKAQKELEELIDNAAITAEKMKKNAKKKIGATKKSAKKTLATVQKDVRKKVNTTKKAVAKKTKAAKKTAEKSIKKATKKVEKTLKK